MAAIRGRNLARFRSALPSVISVRVIGVSRAIGVLIAAAVALPAQQPATVEVTGTVRSAGLAIPGATVTATQGAQKASTTTDDNGRYELDLPRGTWSIQVEMMAFSTSRRDVTVGDAPVNVDYALELRPPPREQFANRGGGPGSGQAGQRGFRNLNLNQTNQIESLTQEAQANAEQQPTAANANEAFLMNGTLDRGLQQSQQPNQFGDGMGGFMRQNQGNPFGQQNGAGQGGPGGPGIGGGGGPGGFGGGRGGWGGPGGGPGGRGGPGARRYGANGPFGNRANRGRQGYHGSLSFSLENSVWDARPFSLTGQTVPKPSYAQSRFSFAGGGPLMIPKLVHSSKTFLFFSYFGTRARNPYDGVGTVPTLAERGGDFSALPGQLYYPGTNTPIPGNVIPPGFLNTTSLQALSLIPLPNQAGIRNYQYTASTGNNADNFGVRANHNLSQKDRFDGNFNAQHRNSDAANLFGYLDPASGAGITTNIGWTHNFSSNTLNRLAGSFSRNSNQTTPFFADNTAANIPIEGVLVPPSDYGPPTISFTNFSTLSDASAVRTVNQTTGVSDTLTLIRGTHSITAGGGYRRMQINQVTDQNARGDFTFTGIETSEFINGQPVPNTGNDFADFLLGYPYSSTVSSPRNDYFRASASNAFVSDDWHTRSNLTLTIGLRWEFFSPYTEKYGRIANLEVPTPLLESPAGSSLPVTEVTQATAGQPAGLIKPVYDLFSPRAGLAWKPWNERSTLVRLGYGIYYNGSIYAQFPAELAAQAPFITNLSLLNGTATPLPIATVLTAAAPTQVTNTYAVDPNYKPGYAQTWNVSIQQNLPRSLIASVEYLGTKGTRLDTEIQPFRTLLAAGGGRVASFVYDESDGNSIFHALQTRLIRRFARGMSLNAVYTFSKSIDDASTIGGGAAVVAQDPYDLSAERGLSSFDQRHTLNLSYVLQSPVGGPAELLHSYPWAERALRDWQLSGGATFTSGLPLTATILGNQADILGNGEVGSSRAEATGLPIEAPGYPYFNPLAFTTPPPGMLGDAGRNTIPGPDQWVLNLSLARSIDLGERRRLEFRIDTKNFTNSVFYTSYGTVVNALNYGLPTAAGAMRTMTMTMRFRF